MMTVGLDEIPEDLSLENFVKFWCYRDYNKTNFTRQFNHFNEKN